MPADGQTIVQEPSITVNGAPAPFLRLLKCERWCGGNKLDTATLEPTLNAEGEYLLQSGSGSIADLFRDRWIGTAINFGMTIEVTVPTSAGEKVIHWGQLTAVQPRYEAAGPGYELVSMLKPSLFGNPLGSYPVNDGFRGDLSNYDGKMPAMPATIRDAAQVRGAVGDPLITPQLIASVRRVGSEQGPRLTSKALIPDAIVFNPFVDGQIVGNLHPQPATGVGLVFVDPEQTLADGEMLAQGMNTSVGSNVRGTGELWTLDKAVYFLCWWLNPVGFKYRIGNPPSLDFLQRVESRVPVTDIVLRNLRIPLGTYLPEALDLLLHPYGLDWFVDLYAKGARRLQFFARGRGPVLPVFHQRPGDTLVANRLNSFAFGFSYDTSKTLNHVRVLGAQRLYEITIQLIPGWDLTDELPMRANQDLRTKLWKMNPAWKDDPKLQKIWRKWVVNEGGSCIGNTIEFLGADGKLVRRKIAKAFDLARFMGLPGSFSVRNRKFQPCITRNPDMTPIGVHGGLFIELSDDGGVTWTPLHTLSGLGELHILEHELGVSFDADVPAGQALLINAIILGKLRIRVTGSIFADDRLGFGREFLDSVAPEEQMEIIDAGDKFHWRKVHQRSQFYSRVRTGRLKSAEVDDTDHIMDLWGQIITWNQADCDGKINLPTIQIGREQLGMVVPKIGGLNFDLWTDSQFSEAPSVVGLSYDYQQQDTTLYLNSYRGKISL